MRILLLNQTFHPDVASTAQHLADLALALAGNGHELTVVTGRRAYDDPSTRFPAREEWNGITIHRIGSTGFGKGARWRRAADFASWLFCCCLKLLTLPRHDVVVALTSPPLISFLGATLTRFRGGEFYYWVMDLNPDEAVEAGWLEKGSPSERLLEWMSRYSLARAEKIIALDRFMRDRIVAKGIAEEKIEVIPPWSHDDAVRFDREGRDRFRRAHGFADRFVVMYSGNHSPCHPLDSLLEAARLLSADSRFLFCFVGGGSEFAKVRQFARDHDLDNVVCLPYQPLDRLAGSLSAADLHVVVMGAPFVGTIHPCKIYNILNVGAPVMYIGPCESHVGDVLAALSGSQVCARAANGDPAAIVDEIRRISEVSHRAEPDLFAQAAGEFSQAALMPRFLAALGAAPGDRTIGGQVGPPVRLAPGADGSANEKSC